MLYLYDKAIVEDLKDSFRQQEGEEQGRPVVGVVSPDAIINVMAQLQDDTIFLPFVTLERNNPIEVIQDRVNFVASKIGVDCLFESEEHNFYKEQSLPIELDYTLTVFTSNQADLDEILRELVFKYNSQYFLDITIPYVSKRHIAFGVSIDWNHGIDQQSGLSEYSQSGTLYRATIKLNCEGCVLVNYIPVHLTRNVYAVDAS